MATFERFNPRSAYGVDQTPEPLGDLASILARHYPSDLRAEDASGFVLLSVDIDAEGHVQQAKAVRQLRVPGITAVAILEDAAGGTTRHSPDPSSVPHPSLREAAERAIREVQFRPASLNGQAVPFWDLRLGVQLAPPAP